MKTSETIDIGDSSIIFEFSSNFNGFNILICVFLKKFNILYFFFNSTNPFGISIIIYTLFPI